MDKKKLSEADICLKFITPALERAGWSIHEQVFMNFTLKPGRMIVRGCHASRDKHTALYADYVLCYKTNIPVAVIEAKDNNHSVKAGMQQAINYAELLEVPFAISSNGDAFEFRDTTGSANQLEQTIALDAFPTPDELWNRFCSWRGWSKATRQIAESPYFEDKPPRYYQINAINRTSHDVAIADVLRTIRELMNPLPLKSRPIGFTAKFEESD